jgi:potassium efflux system protein
MNSLFRVLQLTVLLFAFMALRCAFAADPTSSVTPETLNAKIKEVEATADLDDATRARLTEWYRKTLSHLETARANKTATEAFLRARETAPGEAKTLRDDIEQVAETEPADELQVSDKNPLPEIEQRLLKEKANQAAVAAKLKELDEQLAYEADRPNAVREALSEANQRKEALASELKVPAPQDEAALLTEARGWLLQSEDLVLTTRLQKLDQELLSQPMRIELLKAQREKAALSLDRIDVRIQLLEEMLGGKRLAEAEQAQAEAEQAKREAMGKHTLVQALAAENAALGEELRTVAAELEKINAENDAAEKASKQVEEDFRKARQKLELAGLSQALGRLLLEQRRALPSPRVYHKQAEAREQAIADAGLREIQHSEEQIRLRKLDEYVDALMTGLPVEEADAIRGELEGLARQRQALLDKAIGTDQALLRALGELDFAQRRLIAAAEAYDAFLGEHLLWIRSSPAPSLPMLQDMPEEAAQLLAPSQWLEVLGILAEQGTRSPLLALGAAVFVILLVKARRLRAALQATGKKISKIRTDRFLFTFQALVLTLLLAAPWPLLLATAGWQLALSLEPTAFSRAVARGTIWVSNALFYLEAFRVLCVPGGLAAAHFRWPEASLAVLRRNLVRLMLTFLPAAFVALVAITYDRPTMGGGLGRLAFVIVLLTLAAFFYRLFEPRRGVLHLYLDRQPRSTAARLRYLWLALTVAVPLGLAGLAVVGYLYTAGTLTSRLIDTMWLVLVLVVVHQLVLRWLLLTGRRLAFQAAVERREAMRAAAQAGEAAAPGSAGLLDVVEEPAVDLEALSEDSGKLLNTGLSIIGIIGIWIIWSKVLPAFALLDTITLWDYTALVDGEEKRLPITVADAALALLIAVVTIVATRRFPALLEIGLLQRLRMTSGGRYAATTLSRYAIAAVGVVLVFNTIGGKWSQIQWLVAALGVGIGFGLQEIVANFISGLIILFERPVRVGDVVTVGDTDGVVTRIQIRATTIRNWDRKELLVPNKEFITGRLLNWSLSDQTTRIIISVGLAYGGDVQKAMALMAEAATENEHVMADPPPFVTFEGFGDNALALNLRCYLESLDYRLATITELHTAINQKFNDAGLVIAFPQRDVHLDTSRPLEIRIRRDDEHPGAGA